METLILRAVSVILIGFSLQILLTKIFKQKINSVINNLSNEHIIIQMPSAYKWIGLIGSSILLASYALAIMYPNDSVDCWSLGAVLMFALVGLYLYFAASRWRIHIFRSEDYMVNVPILGKKQTIKYADILHYHNGVNYIKIVTKFKMYSFDNKSTNIEFLLAMLKKNNVKEVITIKK